MPARAAAARNALSPLLPHGHVYSSPCIPHTHARAHARVRTRIHPLTCLVSHSLLSTANFPPCSPSLARIRTWTSGGNCTSTSTSASSTSRGARPQESGRLQVASHQPQRLVSRCQIEGAGCGGGCLSVLVCVPRYYGGKEGRFASGRRKGRRRKVYSNLMRGGGGGGGWVEERGDGKVGAVY